MGDGRPDDLHLGFLTVVNQDPHGLMGGYLLLNRFGRPVEFHCTTPIRPNRAQQILFGPTLAPYLYGEQIGQTLVGKAGVEAAVICTNEPRVLAVRDYVTTPVLLILSAEDDASSATLVCTTQFELCGCKCAVLSAHLGDHAAAAARLERLGAFDFVEPFGRIGEAMIEALASWNAQPSARCA